MAFNFLNVIKAVSAILKGLAARFLFLLFTTIIVWRTIVTIQFLWCWILVVTMIPLIVETYYAVITDHLNQLKWFNLLGFWGNSGQEEKVAYSEFDQSMKHQFYHSKSYADDLGLTDEDWVIALEQMVVFSLIVAKWIAPKGDLTDTQLSQLLLIYIASGADIVELLEIFNDRQARASLDIVAMVLTVWSWSLLQFAIVLTATKKFPSIESQAVTEQVISTSAKKNDSDSSSSEDSEIKREKKLKARREARRKARTLRNFKANLENDASCYNCFCFYNEIWGMVMTLVFQDLPFFITRMFVLIQFRIITQLNLFFTCKNVFLMLLHLNRIRVIHRQDKEGWTEYRQRLIEHEPKRDSDEDKKASEEDTQANENRVEEVV